MGGRTAAGMAEGMKEPGRQIGERRGLHGLRITPARSVALFLLTILLLNPPLLLVFDQAVQFFGLPLLFVYFFASWALVILMIGLGTRRAPDLPAAQEDTPHERDREGLNRDPHAPDFQQAAHSAPSQAASHVAPGTTSRDGG